MVGRARLKRGTTSVKKLFTPKLLNSPFSNFYSIFWNVLGILMCKKRETIGSFLAISIYL